MPLDTSSNIFKRQWRLLAYVVGLIIVFILLWIFWLVLLPFIVGLILAYLLYPLIVWLEKKIPVQGRWLPSRRASLITLVFIVIIVVVSLLAFYIFTGVVSSFSVLLRNANQYFSEGLKIVQGWLHSVLRVLPSETLPQVGNLAQNAGTALGNAM